MRVTDRDDWFELWFADKQSMLNTMISNMTADLANGYNYFSDCIQGQKAQIELYKIEFDRQVDAFKTIEEKEVNRWCYYDMRKRGVIE